MRQYNGFNEEELSVEVRAKRCNGAIVIDYMGTNIDICIGDYVGFYNETLVCIPSKAIGILNKTEEI